ncbi:helix-turn-helix domain-containing protein [Heyndrickxia oleronia]|uniref:helix-turn-helix domain-containing protein n=1 Tax=Heyndrickxia oleronia TaxID=38875 RepID=UPI001C0EB1A7|nr:helix-turn-helix transcriptional regulator [Heyndrickxia oleronia]MBU5212465.1 helix-turn-helix domain-containing protein [Heyndrickxia oleronia]
MELEIGRKIKELRINRGLSQGELAEKINEQFNTTLNKGMVSKWENGLGDPRLEYARYLALFFDVSLDFLLDIEEKQEIETIAAHHDGEEWTEEELNEIERFKEFVKSKRTNKGM